MNDASLLWTSYQQQYSDFFMALTQIEIQNTVGKAVLPNFPRNLPKDLRDKVVDYGKKHLKDHSETTKSDRSWRFQYSEHTDIAERLAILHFVMIWSIIPSGGLPDTEETNKIINAAFDRLVDAQTLIMLFAYLDAFMADSLRVICKVRPQVMRSEKRIDWTWSAALDVAMTEDLKSHLMDRYVLDFGFLSIRKRVEFLQNKPFNLGIECVEEVKGLEYAENLRHIAVHNGGRVSQEYLKRTNRKDVAIGEHIPLSYDFLQRTSTASLRLGQKLFTSIEEKYFGTMRAEDAGNLNRDENGTVYPPP